MLLWSKNLIEYSTDSVCDKFWYSCDPRTLDYVNENLWRCILNFLIETRFPISELCGCLHPGFVPKLNSGMHFCHTHQTRMYTHPQLNVWIYFRRHKRGLWLVFIHEILKLQRSFYFATAVKTASTVVNWCKNQSISTSRYCIPFTYFIVLKICEKFCQSLLYRDIESCTKIFINKTNGAEHHFLVERPYKNAFQKLNKTVLLKRLWRASMFLRSILTTHVLVKLYE